MRVGHKYTWQRLIWQKVFGCEKNVGYMNKLRTLNANPPTSSASAMSMAAIPNAFCHPNSLLQAAIVAKHGMYIITTKAKTII